MGRQFKKKPADSILICNHILIDKLQKTIISMIHHLAILLAPPEYLKWYFERRITCCQQAVGSSGSVFVHSLMLILFWLEFFDWNVVVIFIVIDKNDQDIKHTPIVYFILNGYTKAREKKCAWLHHFS